MGMLNRSAVVIRPLPPSLNWARHDDTTDIAERVFEDLRTAPHVYLLPECEDAESEREVLDDFWPELFAAMLNCWLKNEQQWPKDRTREMLQQWFDVQMCPVIEDLHVDEELVELDKPTPAFGDSGFAAAQYSDRTGGAIRLPRRRMSLDLTHAP